MQKLLLTLLLSVTIQIGFAQNNVRPSRSRFWNAKESTFNIKAGDILVYHVKDSVDEYDYVVTVTKTDNGINYHYNIPAKKVNGSANINATSMNEGTTYQTDFKTTNKTALWLGKANYRDLATTKQTMMDMGNGIDTFTTTNTSTLTINYKGRQKIITIYKVENESETDKIKMAVLTELNNPLIVMMDKGWTLTLTEVR